LKADGLSICLSPERKTPEMRRARLKLFQRIGGYTPACLERAKRFYGRAIKNHFAGFFLSCAEATKLLGKHFFAGVNMRWSTN